MTDDASPIAHTLRALAEGTAQNNVRVVFYRRRDDFMRLWGVGQLAGAPSRPADDRPAGLAGVVRDLKTVGTLVVVWDGAPKLDTGPVDVARYLTPLDWVMALACELETDADDRAGPAVWILCTKPKTSAVSDTERFVDSISEHWIPGIPWARVVRFSDDPAGCQALVDALSPQRAAQAGAASAPRSLFPHKSLHRTAPPGSTLLPAKGVWTSVLTRPSANAGHHDVANLLGPQRLLAESAIPGLRDTAALAQLARSLGLFPRGGDHGDELLREERGWLPDDDAWNELLHEAKATTDRISMCLVDDMWRMGWSAVLCRAFGADTADGETPPNFFTGIGQSAHFRLLATDTPDAAVNALDGGHDLRFAFTLGASPASEVALLDLRLFGGRALAEEAGFLDKLVGIARRRMERGGLPWPRIAESELARIESWCGAVKAGGRATREDPAYIEGMTLLPRLIALADPAYPVIVFSSTGRRFVAEKFRLYENVITAFEKPQVAALGFEDLAYRTASGFRRAMREALRLLTVRQHCLRLPTPPAPPGAPAVELDEAAAEPSGHWTVEVLLDETGGDGRRPLTVGGLTVVYPPGAEPEAWDKAFWKTEDELAGLQRLDCEEFKKRLRKDIRRVSQDVETQAGEKGIEIAAVAVCGTSSATNSAHKGDELFDERQHDNLHRELVRAVLEGAVYDVARRLVGGGSRTLASVWLDVRLATRVKPLHLLAEPHVEGWYKTMLWENLGIDTGFLYQGGKNKGSRREIVHFMNEGAARPLVEEVVQRYLESTFRPLSRVAVAVKLNQSHAPRPPDWKVVPLRARFLHYVADAILAAPHDVPDAWWRRGFGKPTVVMWGWRERRTREWKQARELPDHVAPDGPTTRPVYEWGSRHDERLRSLLNAQRHLLGGAVPDALASGIGHREGGNGSLELSIQRQLRTALSGLSGLDVQHLKNRLRIAPR